LRTVSDDKTQQQTSNKVTMATVEILVTPAKRKLFLAKCVISNVEADTKMQKVGLLKGNNPALSIILFIFGTLRHSALQEGC